MTNSYPAGSSAVPDSSVPTGAPGFGARRSSYASVVSGTASGNLQQYQQPSRSGAFSHLLNQSTEYYEPSYHNQGGHMRYDSRTYDMDFGANGASHGRSASWGRNVQLPPSSTAYMPIMNGNAFGFGGSHADSFFIPSYLRGSKYVQKLEEGHKAKERAHKDGPSAQSSQPGSLSTSASSSHLHGKMAASHRGMTYDLIEKAPPAEDETLAPLPSRWNSQDKYGGLEVMSDGQEVKFTGPKPERDREHEACAIRADHPMPPQCGIYYYEVTVISRKREESSIGIGFSSKNVPLSRLPGWEPDSWAYHGDDGHSFGCQSTGKHYGPPFMAGDVVGCGVNFRTGSAFFTKNGDYLGVAFREIKGKLFPSVGMKKSGEHIRVNFGQSPFVFDIDGMMSVSGDFNISDIDPETSSIHYVTFEDNSLQRLPSSLIPGTTAILSSAISPPLLYPQPRSTTTLPQLPPELLAQATAAIPPVVPLVGVPPGSIIQRRRSTTLARLGVPEDTPFLARVAWEQVPGGSVIRTNLPAEATAIATAPAQRAPGAIALDATYDGNGNWTPSGSDDSTRASVEPQRIDIALRDEKKAIHQEISQTSTEKLAPPMNETELIQSLVLQFLTHDGYIETARAFANEVHSEESALTLDPNAVVKGVTVKEDKDAGHRQQIRTAVLDGDIEKALRYTNAYYPHVLKDNEHVYFRLRCRRFIEMIRQGAEIQQSANNHPSKKSNGHNGDWYDDVMNQDMEMDGAPSQPQSAPTNWDRMDTEDSPAETQMDYDTLLQATLDYGVGLQAEFKDDPRREVGKALEDAFALMAYQDPLSHKEVAHLLDPAGRLGVAEELNAAILSSLGKSSSAALETLYQQTSVLLEDLREGGGPGAFVNIDDFTRPTRRQ